jgi:hypothetical protein
VECIDDWPSTWKRREIAALRSSSERLEVSTIGVSPEAALGSLGVESGFGSGS